MKGVKWITGGYLNMAIALWVLRALRVQIITSGYEGVFKVAYEHGLESGGYHNDTGAVPNWDTDVYALAKLKFSTVIRYKKRRY